MKSHRIRSTFLYLGMMTLVFSGRALAEGRPVICSIELNTANLSLVAHIPAGYGHAVLEMRDSMDGPWTPLVAGSIDGRQAWVQFQIPTSGKFAILRARVGADPTVPRATYSGAEYFAVNYDSHGGESGAFNSAGPYVCNLTQDQKIGHLLNRIAYGPSLADIQWVKDVGIEQYINLQLNPTSINESDNVLLLNNQLPLFDAYYDDDILIPVGATWSYFKGIREPSISWRRLSYIDARWSRGPSGLGYDYDDDAPVLDDLATFFDDMRQIDGQEGYTTVYFRRLFEVPDPTAIDRLSLQMVYDDGFVAFINGTEVARVNVDGFPRFNSRASGIKRCISLQIV